MRSKKRIATIFISYSKSEIIIKEINLILKKFKHLILNQAEVRDEHNKYIISILAKLTTDELGALTGALGRIRGLKIKSAVLPLNNSKK